MLDCVCHQFSSYFCIHTVVVNFPVVGQEGVSLVAWTTTPWTLPSNMALCVNPELDYVKVQGKVRWGSARQDKTG